MISSIFVNLPVESLTKSVDFFSQLGFKFNPQFTDETSTCMLVNDKVFVMLVEHEKFAGFIKKKIAPSDTTEVILSWSCESPEQVREVAEKAFALGATRWAMIKAVVIPHGRSGVVGGAMLGLGRAMGETVAVYTVLNIVFQINWHVLLGAGGNVASLIILKFGEASAYEIKALMAAGLVLFVLTLTVNAAANFIVKRTGKSGR